MPRVLNKSKGTVVAERLRVARSLWSRFWGLMGRRDLPHGEGLLLRSTSSIHTAFMRFPIDVVFIDRSQRVVKVAPEVKPFRISLALRGARSALELPSGMAAAARVEPGDELVIDDGD